MNPKIIGLILTLTVLYATATTRIFQDKKSSEKWIELAQPSAAHKFLQPRVGGWTMKVRHFETTGEVQIESDASSQVEWIMDGRYIYEKMSGTFMGMPFNGIGICGYDNLKMKYVASWVDNMGTGIMASEGTYDNATKTFTYASESPDPMTGKQVTSRTTEKWTDNEHWTMQVFRPGPDGKPFLAMEVNATRMK